MCCYEWNSGKWDHHVEGSIIILRVQESPQLLPCVHCDMLLYYMHMLCILGGNVQLKCEWVEVYL